MHVLCKCSECGGSVRRDDGPLAPPQEQPKRLALFVGPLAVKTLDFCNECFETVRASLHHREQLKLQQESAPVTIEGLQERTEQ